jgi:hypothetical protein
MRKINLAKTTKQDVDFRIFTICRNLKRNESENLSIGKDAFFNKLESIARDNFIIPNGSNITHEHISVKIAKTFLGLC